VEREVEVCGGAYTGQGAASAENVALRPVPFAERASCDGDIEVVAGMIFYY